MGISSLIRKEKEKFFAAKLDRDKSRIIRENAKLEKIKAREAELAKVNTKRENLQRDVGKLRSYNKRVAGPSKVQRFGSGLAKVMNEGKSQLAKQKAKTGGINFGGTGKDPFGGGSTGDPFGMKPKAQPKKKNKVTKIIIQQ